MIALEVRPAPALAARWAGAAPWPILQGIECPRCPEPAVCRCACGCVAHSHFWRCRECAAELHRGASVTLRAALAFGDWPPPRPDRLAHLLDPERKVH